MKRKDIIIECKEVNLTISENEAASSKKNTPGCANIIKCKKIIIECKEMNPAGSENMLTSSENNYSISDNKTGSSENYFELSAKNTQPVNYSFSTLLQV